MSFARIRAGRSCHSQFKAQQTCCLSSRAGQRREFMNRNSSSLIRRNAFPLCQWKLVAKTAQKFFTVFYLSKRISFSILRRGLYFPQMRDVFAMVDEYRQSQDFKLLEAIVMAISDDITLFVAGRVPEADVLDVRQEILLEIIRGLAKFRGDTRESFFSWGYIIARAMIAKYHRTRGRQPQPHPDIDELANLVQQNADNGHSSEEDIRDALEALEVLRTTSPECYELLFNRYVLGFSLEVIGKFLGISADAARMRAKRCEDRLEKD